MNEKRKSKLSRSMLAGVLSFALILIILTTFLLSWNYYNDELSGLKDDAFAYARSASRFIDGDKVREYIKEGLDNNHPEAVVNEPYYQEVEDYLASVLYEHELMKYYYVFVPYEDTVTYIWDGDQENPSLFGDTEEYMDGGKEAVERIYNQDPEETFEIYEDETWGRIACAFYPIYDSGHEPVAVVGVDVSRDTIRSTIIGYIVTILFVMGGVLIIGSLVLYLLIRRRIIDPIGKLNNAAQKLVQNLDSGEEFQIDIHTRDELEELAQSFGTMDADLKDYIQQLSTVTAEKERIGAELNVAAQIQTDMLPRVFPAFPDRSDFDIYATMTPAKEVGGDFYDFFFIDDDHLALVMADVSGKGVPAALFMVITKTLIKNHAQSGESPSEILKNVNEQLLEGNEAEMFVTVWLAIVELSTGKGVAANAGHEHPALRRQDGCYELVKYPHACAVATVEGLEFPEHEFRLYPGDSLFVYTDGVPEAGNSDFELFKTDRMLEALNQDPCAAPKELLNNVWNGIQEFVGDVDPFDDMTMMAFNYFGTGAEDTEEPEDAEDAEELTLDATLENLNQVLSFLDTHLEALDFHPKKQMQLDLAVEELFVNIANYAYGEETGKATVRFVKRSDPTRVVITLIDGGIPYDPLKKPDPDQTLPAEERPIGGLGIFMAKNYTDRMKYQRKDGKNILRLEKNLE